MRHSAAIDRKARPWRFGWPAGASPFRGLPATLLDIYPLTRKKDLTPPPSRCRVRDECEPHSPLRRRLRHRCRSGRSEESAHSPPEWLVRLLAQLIFFLLQHVQGMRLRRCRRMYPWWHDRPDLPAGSSQAETASLRGPFGRSIRWMCLRHGIGQGHPDWPELSRAIVAFGGSLKGFRAGAPPCELLMVGEPRRRAGHGPWVRRARHGNTAATAGSCECRVAGAARHASASRTRSRACKVARAMVVRFSAAIFCARRSKPIHRATGLPGTANFIMSDTRGRSMASPAIVIRAD